MINNQFAIAPPGDNGGNFGLELLELWRVEAGLEYHPARPVPAARGRCVLVRTHAGVGRLELTDGRDFLLVPGTFLAVPDHRILAYRTVKATWRFSWLVCRTVGTLPCELRHCYPCAEGEEEEETLGRTLADLRSPDHWLRRRAAARVQELLYGWLGGSEPRQRRVDPALEHMHRQLEQPPELAELAQLCHLTPRHFRRLFVEATGETPKRYFNRLRLEAAAAVLKNGQGNIKETADRFGFKTQFHFSCAFRKQFGAPPSLWLRSLAE